MLKKVIKSKIFVTLFFILFISCNENQTNIKDEIDKHKPNGIVYVTNPFEYIGQEHNIGLEYFLNFIEQEQLTFSDCYEDPISFNNEVAFVLYETYHETDIDTNITLIQIVESLNILPNFKGDSANNFFDNMFYERFNDYIDNDVLPYATENDSYWIDKIRDLHYQFCYENLNEPTVDFPFRTHSWYLQQINQLEIQMLQYEWDIEDHKALEMLSLLKYSSDFWFNKIFITEMNKKTKETMILDAKSEFKQRLIMYAKWKFIITADIAGGANALATSGTAALIWEFLEDLGIIEAWAEGIAKGIYG